ncbi:MAG: RHS repeat-associated core domain-containing protein [Kiritimatiellia bacterium]
MAVSQAEEQREDNPVFSTVTWASGSFHAATYYSQGEYVRYGVTWYNTIAQKIAFDMPLTIDLTDYTTNNYDWAELWWPVKKYRFNKLYETADCGTELALGVTQLVHRYFEAPWAWGGYSRFKSVEWESKTFTRVPQVKLFSQNYDNAPESTRPDPCPAPVGDPINTINGNVELGETDIYIPCPGPDINLSRSYNSTLDYNNTFGHRWTHSYDWSLSSTTTVFKGTENSWKILQTGQGTRFWFEDNEGVVSSPYDAYAELESNTNNSYELTLRGGTTYLFDSNGVLQSISDMWGNTLTLSYTNSYPNHLLTRVEHDNGQYLNFSNQNGRIVRVDTPLTNFYMSYFYNNQNELTNATRTTAEACYSTTYSYDSTTNHSLTQRVNSAGHIFRWEYVANVSGHVTSKGNRTVIGTNYYDTALSYATTGVHKTLVTYDRNGSSRGYEYWYDPIRSRITDIKGPNPAVTNWTNTGTGIRYGHDDDGNITNQTTYDYGLNEWHITTRKFDACHNVTAQAFAYCRQVPSNNWIYTWHPVCQGMTSKQDPEGCIIEYEYTNASMSKSKLYYNSTSSYDTIYAYTTNGLLSAATNANTNWVRYTYDSYGFLSSADPEAGPTINYSFSQLGHLTNISMPGESGNRITTLDVNELGRVTGITYPDDSSESFSYDSLGNLTNHVDTAGRTTRYTYLPTRKLSSIVRVMSGGTEVTNSFTYDNQFNTLDITDAKGRLVEAYTLDIQDRPATVGNLEDQTMTVAYGVADYVNSINRFDGTTVSNSYNSQGLLSDVKYSDSTNRFTYLKNGLLETAVNENGTVSNTYNSANRLTSSSGSVTSGKVNYAYLPAGNVRNVSSAAGSADYSYDAAERVTDIDTSDGSFDYTCNTNNGLISKVACTNTGGRVDYTYDEMDRITGITWKDSSGNVLKSFSYTYNNAGMITGVELDSGQDLQYTYDDLDRLTGEERLSSGGQTIYDIGYGYDSVGNRTGKTIDGTGIDYSFNYGPNGNRLSSWTTTLSQGRIDVVGNSTELIGTNSALGQLYVSNTVKRTPEVEGTNYWAYDMPVGLGTQQVVAAIGDEAGNVSYDTNTVIVAIATNGSYSYSSAGCITNIVYDNSDGTSDTNSISWNQQYQITSMATNGVTAESFQYDALGRRTRVVSGGTTNYLVYDGIHVVAEVDASGNLQKSYTWGPGIDNLLAFTDYTGGSTNTYYALTDHLGTVHAVTDENGNIVESYRFDAWGRVLGVYDGDNQVLSESAIGNNYLWQGRWYSWDTGMYYFRARWYDPITGRWLSKDPIGISGGLNQYAVMGNNPVNFRDPFGLCEDLGSYGDPRRSGPSIGRGPAYRIRRYTELSAAGLAYDAFRDSYGVAGSLAYGSAFRGSLRLTTFRPSAGGRITNYELEMMSEAGGDPATGESIYRWTGIQTGEQAEQILSRHPDLVERAVRESTPSRFGRFLEWLGDLFTEVQQQRY